MSRHRVARLPDVWAGEMVTAQVGFMAVVLLNVEGKICAYQDRCPHRAVPLSRGRLDGGTLICTAHDWCYDARTGEGINPRGSTLRRLPVYVVGDDIFVEVDDENFSGDEIRVGPVLEVSSGADAVVSAILRLNQDVEILDRGSYLRVLARGGCRVTRAAIEEDLRAPFTLPGDLERIMPSFKGRLSITDEEVRWEVPVTMAATLTGRR